MIIKSNFEFLSQNVISNLNNLKQNKNSIEFKKSKDNFIIPCLNNLSLHSTYYPLKDSDKIIFSTEKDSICIAIGFGAGYHLFNYFNNTENDILVIPLDYNLLYKTLENINLKTIFKSNKLKIISFDEINSYFDYFKYKNYFLIIHPVLQKLYNNEIINIINYLKDNFNPILLEINTQRKFGYIWQNNILKNLIYFFENKLDFSTLTINKPILIAGAGPSLDKNIKLIQKNRENLYIASSDTGLKVLSKNNIIPDSVFSFDAQNYSYLHFINSIHNFRLFTDFTSSLRIPNLRQTILYSNHPFAEILFQAGFNKIFLSSNSRNIGGAMIDFFTKYFRDLPIISVGIDYGYFNYNSYSKGSYLNEYQTIFSDYFTTSEFFDSSIFYKNILTKIKDNWTSNKLLTEYSNSSNINVYSISDSPYIKFKKVDFEYFLKTRENIKEKSLIFEKPSITKEKLYTFFCNYIQKDSTPLISYFLSIGKKPLKSDIDNFLLNIKNYFI